MKKLTIITMTLLLAFSLAGCRKKQESINYQDSIDIPTLIEVDISNVPERFDDYVEIKNYDNVLKVSFDMEQVYFDTEGDYSIRIIVDYADGVSKTFGSVLRLTNPQEFGMPRIIGIKNRIFNVNTQSIDLLEGIAFTDTTAVVDFGVNGDVDYTTEGVYKVEYYVEDNDGNIKTSTAFVIIGSISKDYIDFTDRLYNLTIDEKAILYDYSLLYTVALENRNIDVQTLLDSAGFFVTPSLFEIFLQRELRDDEVEAIERAQEIFQKNTVRFLREKFDVTLSEIEREYLERIYEIRTKYIDSFTAYNLPTSIIHFEDNHYLLLSEATRFSEFDLQAIEFYDRIERIYQEKNLLLVEQFTDYEITKDVLDFEENHFYTSFGNGYDLQFIYRNYVDSNLENDAQKLFYDYQDEYMIQNYLLEHNHLDISVDIMMMFIDYTALIIQNTYQQYFGNHPSWYLDEEMFEEIMERPLNLEEQEVLEVFIEMHHDITSNFLVGFLEQYEDDINPELQISIQNAYKALINSGYSYNDYRSFMLYNYSFTEEEQTTIVPYLQFLELMFQRQRMFGYNSSFAQINILGLYSLDYFTSAVFLNYDKEDIIYFDPDFDVDSAYTELSIHNSYSNIIYELYPSNMSVDENLVIHETLKLLAKANVGVSAVNFLYTNDLSLIDNVDFSSFVDPEVDVEALLDTYIEVTSRIIEAQKESILNDDLFLCVDSCLDAFNTLAERVENAPLLISNDNSSIYGDITLSHIPTNYYDNVYIMEAINSFNHEKEIIQDFINDISRSQAANGDETVPYLRSYTVYSEEYKQNLIKFFQYYKSGKNADNFGVPSKLLMLDYTEVLNEFEPLTDEEKAVMSYLYQYQKNELLKNETGGLFYLLDSVPKLINQSVLADYYDFNRNSPLIGLDTDYEQYRSEHQETLQLIETYKSYLNDFNEIRSMYQMATELDIFEELEIVTKILIEQDLTLLSFIPDVKWMYVNDGLSIPWFNELSEYEKECFYSYGDLAMRSNFSLQYYFLFILDDEYYSSMFESAYQLYREIAIAGGFIEENIVTIEGRLNRILNDEEVLLLEKIQHCSHLFDCALVDEVDFMISNGFLVESFTLLELYQAYQTLQTVRFDEIKYVLPLEMSFNQYATFVESNLKQEEHVTREYISRFILDQIQLEIEELFEIEDQNALVAKLNQVQNFISTIYSVDESSQSFTFSFQFYDEEQYGDIYNDILTLFVVYEIHSRIETISDAVFITHMSPDRTSSDYYFDLEETLRYYRDYVKIDVVWRGYGFDATYVTMMRRPEREFYILPQDLGGDDRLSTVNQTTAKIYVAPYLVAKGVEFTEEELLHYCNVFGSYHAYERYSDQTTITGVMSEIGFTITDFELQMLQDLEISEFQFLD